MAKSLSKSRFCKLSYDKLGSQLADYVASVSDPKYICERCCRVSHNKQNLCRPKKIKV